jgi:uncharacterized cofD-like protein
MPSSNVLNNENIVVFCGGKGAAAFLRYAKNTCTHITVVVATSDSGGSSGELSHTRDIPAVGDTRNVVRALIPDNEPLLQKRINHRFKEKEGSWLNNHPLGNLELVAYLEMFKGNWLLAIQEMMRVYKAGHRVLPVTTDRATLCAHFDDGTKLRGEGFIDTRSIECKKKIVRVSLEPHARLYPPVYDAIMHADKIIFSAGSFWTSLIPILCVKGMREALRDTKAKFIYVVNIMTNHNETRRWTASQHVRHVYGHIGRMLDVVICNDSEISEEAMEAYASEGAEQVHVDDVQIEKMYEYAHRVITGDFAYVKPRKSVRHTDKLATCILGLQFK